MRNLIVLLCLVLAIPALAKESVSQTRTRLKGYLKTMSALEREARGIEPMHIPIKQRTPAQNKEMERRIEFLDNLLHQRVRPLGSEIRSRGSDLDPSMALPNQAVGDAYNALDDWLNTKLELQNAGVNNPGLETLKKNEPQRYQEYQAKWQAAQDQLK